jgi:hypothetical protein
MPAMTYRPSIHVDMQGTLMRPTLKNHKLVWVADQGLVQALSECAQAGHKVVFHTGGDPERQSDDFRATVKDPHLLACLPVQRKDALEGRTIDIAIDDTPAYRLRADHGFEARALIQARAEKDTSSDPDFYRTRLAVAVAGIQAHPPAPPPAAAPAQAFRQTTAPAPSPAPERPGWLKIIRNRLGL